MNRLGGALEAWWLTQAKLTQAEGRITLARGQWLEASLTRKRHDLAELEAALSAQQEEFALLRVEAAQRWVETLKAAHAVGYRSCEPSIEGIIDYAKQASRREGKRRA